MSGAISGIGYAGFKLAFQISPIILSSGIAINLPNGLLPIFAITEALNFPLGLLSGAENIELDGFFANFVPLPGATLVDIELGKYPFPNQAVAANATVAQPLVCSFLMHCPAKNAGGYAAKLVTMTALKSLLDQHNSLGGTYVLMTPSFISRNWIMKRMEDASLGTSAQLQNAWRLDFEKPLLTIGDANAAQSSLISKLTNGTQSIGQPAWSGSTTVPTTGIGSGYSIAPGAGGLQGPV